MYKEICCDRKNVERQGSDMNFPKQLLFVGNNKVAMMDLKTKEKKTTTYELKIEDNGNGVKTTYIQMASMPKGILRFEKEGLSIDYGYMDLQKEFYKKGK